MKDLRVGLIVNPIAGLGGPVGLKGSDDRQEILPIYKNSDAYSLNSILRAARALRSITKWLNQDVSSVKLYAAAGVMGELSCKMAGFQCEVVGKIGDLTTADDTKRYSYEFLNMVLDFLLFCGGDGTARDIVGVVDKKMTCLGIPAGVKMHSAVFATTPESIGEIVYMLVARPEAVRYADREVLDFETRPFEGPLLSFGYMRVPYVPNLVQNAKALGFVMDDGFEALCESLAKEMEPSVLYIVGPGTSSKKVLEYLGIQGTVNGIDAVADRKLVGVDLSETDLLKLFEKYEKRKLILGVIGGQGYLLGRGNQQLSVKVLQQIGSENITVISSMDKLSHLWPPVLHVDLGQDSAYSVFGPYIRVRVDPETDVVMKVSNY